MKLTRAALILGLTVVQSAMPLYAREPQFSLRAEPDSQTVLPKQEAKINLIRTNLGQNDERIKEDNAGPSKAEFDFTVRIHDGDGNTPAFTDYGRLRYGKLPDNMVFIDSYELVTIVAGQSKVSSMDVGKLYQLLPGKTYLVSCTLITRRSAMSTPLTSNWVKIIVK